MKTMVISLDSIIADPLFNVRYSLSPTEVEGKKSEGNKSAQSVEELAKSIIRDGLMNPLVVIPGKDGNYNLVAGFRRYTALLGIRQAGKEGKLPKNSRVENPDVVTVNVFEGKPEDAAILNLNENIQRKDLTTFEMSYSCWNLKKNFSMTIEKIASRTMLSNSHVTNLVRAYEQLADRIKEAWRECHGACTTDWLFMICKESKENQDIEWEKRLQERGTEKGKHRKANGEGGVETKTHRPLPSVVESALQAINADRNIDATVKQAYTVALEFALGKRKDIPNIYDSDAVEKAKKDASEKDKQEKAMVRFIADNINSENPAMKEAANGVIKANPSLKKMVDEWLSLKAKVKAEKEKEKEKIS